MDQCTSCKINVANKAGTVKFKCPSCQKFDIVRCENCRKTVAKYVCPSCGFTGPN
jgi:Zn-ribbon RNA-binding protein